MGKKLLCAIALLLVLMQGALALAMTRQEMRAAYQAISSLRTDASPYEEEPDAAAFSTAGRLTEEKLGDALAYLNFLRAVAGLDAVQASEIYNLRSQNAALLLAANDFISHNPPCPEGMNPDLYDSGLLGASLSNLAHFNWMQPDILLDGIAYFARDDGDMNLSSLGHRRWLLNPRMAETGFGLANALSGHSYVVMFAVDDGNADAEWDHVAWPSAGAFPVELMRSSLAWSVSLNDEIYDLDASSPTVYMKEKLSGAQFRFNLAEADGDGYCSVSRENYGAGSCIIFRPELEDAGISEYLQNQVWEVEISGLVKRDGSAAVISYSCEMASLYPQDVANIELSQLESELAPGEMLKLSATVIPSYADDLTVNWSSSDEDIATVDFFGNVTAMQAGSCEITAASANGRADVCRITVK
ncbi:MAG: Ig-like domain-containing protein [Clostridia bacterium]|nr:Ig-like domain-containing protein [Clostridia bacterium]